MLSERSQSQKDKCCVSHLHKVHSRAKLIKTERRTAATKTKVRKEQTGTAYWVRSFCLKRHHVLEADNGDGCTTLGT